MLGSTRATARKDGPHLPDRATKLLAILGVAVVIAASAPSSHARHGIAPRRVGPIVTIVSGTDWNLVGWRTAGGGFCFAYGAPGAGGNGCTTLPRVTLPRPLVYGGAFPDRWRIVGLASAAVTRVELQLPSGRVITAKRSVLPQVLHAHLSAYVLEFRLKAGRRASVMPTLSLRAYAATGVTIGRLVI
jgi:hypothetical protein